MFIYGIDIMKVYFRKSTMEDLEEIYEKHKLCFGLGDITYENNLRRVVPNSWVCCDENQIIGALLQGPISYSYNEKDTIFIEVKDNKVYGICVLFVLKEYRRMGIGKILIELHLKENNDKDILGLNVRKSNPAYNLYKKYYQIAAIVKNYYVLPDEDAYFMIRKKIMVKE